MQVALRHCISKGKCDLLMGDILMKKRFCLLAILGLLPALTGSECSATGGRVLDKSSFIRFEYRQEGANLFIPDPEIPYQARIEKQNGQYKLSISYVVTGDPYVDVCVDDLFSIDDTECLIVQELDERTLTEAEVQLVLETFGAIKTAYEMQLICYSSSLMETFQWDHFQTYAVAPSCFYGGNIIHEFLLPDCYAEIINLLNKLGGRSEISNPRLFGAPM